MKDALLASALMNVGGVLMRKRLYGQGAEVFRRALTLRRAVLPPENPGISRCMHNLGACLLGEMKYDQALAQFEECLEIRRWVGAHRE